jgi:integrase
MAAARPLNPDEEKRLLAAMERFRDQLLYLSGRLTGVRVSELLSLTIGDVWRDGRTVDQLVLARRRLKGGRGPWRRRITSRVIPLHPQLKAAIQTYIVVHLDDRARNSSAPLFVSRQVQGNGGGPRAICRSRAYRIIRQAAKRSIDQSRVGTHSMRKTFALDVYRRTGNDLVLTQKALGHSSILNTVKYLTPQQEAVERAILDLPAPIGFSSKPSEAMSLRELIGAAGAG